MKLCVGIHKLRTTSDKHIKLNRNLILSVHFHSQNILQLAFYRPGHRWNELYHEIKKLSTDLIM